MRAVRGRRKCHLPSATMRPQQLGLAAWRDNRRGRYLRVERTFIDIEAAPADLLHSLGKDQRLVPYGGANFGMPLQLIEPAESRIVPNDRFFLRSNGPVPVVDPTSWRLGGPPARKARPPGPRRES